MGMNFLVGQSGGPTAVINSSLAGVYATARQSGAGKIYGMQYGIQGLLDEKPRDPNKSILDRALLSQIVWQGGLIAIASMLAFYLGLSAGGAAMASTMAFATLTLARLFHGFNCRGKESIFKLGMMTNKYSLLAFVGGLILLVLVLSVPALSGLFMITPLTGMQYLQILGLAFAPTLLIQLGRVVRGR